MAGEHVKELARRTAAVLPEPPSADDPFGYLAWEELVLDAATRLGALQPGPVPVECPAGLLHLSPGTGRLDAEALTALATVMKDAGAAGGEALLQMSVEAWRLRTRSVAAALAHRA